VPSGKNNTFLIYVNTITKHYTRRLGAWDGINALIVSGSAYLFLGERFDHFTQYVGLVFIIVGVYLLKIPLRKQTFLNRLKQYK
jgi:uncharacterized membrane protein